MNDMKSKNPHKLSLTVQYACDARLAPTRAQLRRWISTALKHDARITLRIVDETEGRKLNNDYRGKDYATNVLTFVYDDEETIPDRRLSGGKGSVSGDIVICAPIVEQEATVQKKDVLAHYAHLAIHATLHMQGYTHEHEQDAAAMESLESALMLKLRYPDPYQVTGN